MDQITFHHNTVLSDVHLLLPNSSHMMTRLNGVGQPVFISRFKILWSREESCDLGSPNRGEGLDCDTQEESRSRDETRSGTDGGVEPPLDEDGDLEVTRRHNLPERCTDRDMVHPVILSQAGEVEEEEEEEVEESRDLIKIEHTMATPLEDVGKQVWRGAFLLADLILSQPNTFKGATVLELGAGTGLTSVVMAMVAKMVYCTDVGEDLLSMCQKNVMLNKHFLEPTGGEVKVRQLDWLKHDFCINADEEFGWTEDEVADLYDNTAFIIAADVCYDDDLTDALFRTLYRICNQLHHPCTAYLSIEKRLNFTVRQMDVSCEAYDHFRHCLSELEEMKDGRTSFTVEQVSPNFPQCLQYERVELLELWKVTAAPI
ncbi:methyltransferase-like protein 22 [Esox lucius]|nr:methyltransferase-like protein 22 [Esox lucius]XP_012991608.2 methyltransferase-like protein 22 [Esox lucius]